MYRCQDCGKIFSHASEYSEPHALPEKPYEKWLCCPYCAGTAIKEKTVKHCRCCGARLSNGKKDYCNESCRRRGERLWREEQKRRKLREIDPIAQVVKLADTYNKEHNTSYSYGQFVALVLSRV